MKSVLYDIRRGAGGIAFLACGIGPQIAFEKPGDGNGGFEAEFEVIVKDFKKAADEVKKIAETANTEVKNLGKLNEETKKTADELLVKQNDLSARMTELEKKMVREPGEDDGETVSVGTQVEKSDDFKRFKDGGARGSVRVAVKDITSVAGSAGTLIQNQRLPGVLMLPQYPRRIRSLLDVQRTTTNMIEYVKELGFTNNAAVVSEGVQKPESEITFEEDTAPIRTIAHWIHISRQAMDDAPQIRGIIDGRLRFGLQAAEEDEILNGDGTGQHLDGLISQATAYSAPITVSGATGIDTLRLAMLQASIALYPANGIVIHPNEWARIELTKTTDGAYLFANPQSLVGPTLWGLPVVATQAMAGDDFLVGAFNTAATLWERMDAEVLISSEDRDNFVKNMLTVRAEERIGLAVYRPEALIYGDFGTVSG